MTDSIGNISEIRDRAPALWCAEGLDAAELVRLADSAAACGAPLVCCAPESAHMLWGWLEKSGTQIYARFNAGALSAGILAGQISASLKRGADGIVLLGAIRGLMEIAADLFPVRHDLFFGKKVLVGTDILSIEPFEWEDLLFTAKKLSADGIVMTCDGGPKANQFVGKVFGLFDSLPADFAGQLLFKTNGAAESEAVLRLAQKMRPDIATGPPAATGTPAADKIVFFQGDIRSGKFD
jgi:hypothetical protein